MKRLIIGTALAGMLAGAGLAQAPQMTPEAVFGFVDSDGDGSLTFAEINEANANVTEEVFAEFDDNGDGVLSQAEFADLFENGPQPPGL